MQIVIDIPEKVCEDHKNNRYIDVRLFKSGDEFNRAVADICDHPYFEEMSVYTLPKGHGRLIDVDKVWKTIPAEDDNATGFGMTYGEMKAYNDGINAMYGKIHRAPTVLEADKDGEI